MARNLTIQEAKALPMWAEMNRYIKEVLHKEMGDVDYEILQSGDHWDVHVDGVKIAEIGIIKVEEGEIGPGKDLNKEQLN